MGRDSQEKNGFVNGCSGGYGPESLSKAILNFSPTPRSQIALLYNPKSPNNRNIILSPIPKDSSQKTLERLSTSWGALHADTMARGSLDSGQPTETLTSGINTSQNIEKIIKKVKEFEVSTEIVIRKRNSTSLLPKQQELKLDTHIDNRMITSPKNTLKPSHYKQTAVQVMEQ